MGEFALSLSRDADLLPLAIRGPGLWNLHHQPISPRFSDPQTQAEDKKEKLWKIIQFQKQLRRQRKWYLEKKKSIQLRDMKLISNLSKNG